MKKTLVVISFVLSLAAVASADDGIRLHCHVKVPQKYKDTPFNPPPNGEPESVRYTEAYKAFWWNCVAVRAADLQGRCPFTASGTPAASAGANDGSLSANFQIDSVLKKHPASALYRYLRSIASSPEAKENMQPYFDKPTREDVK